MVEITVVGTDPSGLTLIRELVETGATVASIGPEPESDWEDRINEFPLPTGGITTSNEAQKLLQTPNRRATGLVQLQPLSNGFQVTAIKNGELTVFPTHTLVFSSPCGSDLIADTPTLPGADSSVAGFIIDRLDLPLVKPGAILSNPGNATGAGFDVTTEGLRVAGMLHPQNELPEVDRLVAGTEPVSTSEEIPDLSEFEDVELPEGFVETKTGTLTELVTRCYNFEPETDSRNRLQQRVEGVAGEIDSYSRFRPEPELLKLRWKTLLGMNLIQPLFRTNKQHG